MFKTKLQQEDIPQIKDYLKEEYDNFDRVNTRVFHDLLDKLTDVEVLFLFELLQITERQAKLWSVFGGTKQSPESFNFDEDDDDFGEGGDMWEDDDESDFF